MATSEKDTKTAEKPDEKKHTIKAALKEISTAGGIAIFLITMLTSFSLPGILTTILQGSFSLDAEGLTLMGKMISLTAPLTIGISIVILALMREWITEVWGTALLTSAVLVVTTLLLREDGQSILSTAWSRTTGNPFFYFPIQLLLEYFRIYFWAPFVSSFIIGFFISWSVYRLMKVKSWAWKE